LPSSILPPLPDEIYDREDEFEEFKGQKRICISGMSGVGKSTLAIKYGSSRKGAKPPALVRFFKADTEAKLNVDFICLAKLLQISEDNDDHRIELVYQKLGDLENSDLEILFIFDNVENYQFVKKYVCNLPEAISVLVTVRNKDTVQINDDEWYNIELGPFSSEESTEYIQKVLGGSSKIKDEQIKEILDMIGDDMKREVIPFHLNKVVTLLKNRFGSFEKSLNTIRNSKKWLTRNDFYDEFMKIEIVEKIFKYIPYFDPDSIDLSLLAEMIDQEENDDWDKALQRLETDFIVKVNEDRKGISVHRLLQKELSLYFEKKFENKEINEIRQRFTEIIDNNLKMEYIVSGASEQVPYTHADRLIQTNWFQDPDLFPDSEKKAIFFEKLGFFFSLNEPLNYNLADTGIPNIFPKRAKECFLKTLNIRETLDENPLPVKVSTYNDIGRVCYELGELDFASENLEKGLRMNSDLGIPFNYVQLETHYISGKVYLALEKFNEALEQFKKAFKIKETLGFKDDKLLADLYKNIGIANFKINQMVIAKKCFTKTLEIRKKLYHEGHLETVQTYNLIGRTCLALEEFDCASDNLKKALVMNSNFNIPFNPYLLESHFLSGSVYIALKKFEEASEQFNEACNMKGKPGINNFELSSILYLSNLYRNILKHT